LGIKSLWAVNGQLILAFWSHQTNPRRDKMRFFPILMLTATMALCGSAYSADKTAPGGTGVEQSTEGQGATNKDTTTNTPMGSKSGSATGMQPGTGVEDNVQGEGATTKQGVNETKPGNATPNMGGASAGNAAGGTGVETSSQAEGAKNKTTNE
jgi:hypothetical protein